MNNKLKQKVFAILIFAALLNFIWEVAHSGLYSYAYTPNFSITIWALLLSTFGDVVYTFLVIILFLKFFTQTNLLWLLIIGVIFAIFWERFGLYVGLWQYNSAMPIIPLINTGLTPTIRLGLLSYLVLKIVGVENISSVRLTK